MKKNDIYFNINVTLFKNNTKDIKYLQWILSRKTISLDILVPHFAAHLTNVRFLLTICGCKYPPWVLIPTDLFESHDTTQGGLQSTEQLYGPNTSPSLIKLSGIRGTIFSISGPSKKENNVVYNSHFNVAVWFKLMNNVFFWLYYLI